MKNISEFSSGGGREVLLGAIEATLQAVRPDRLIEKSVRIERGKLTIKTERKSKSLQLSKFNNLYIIGWGKASGLMAEGIERILPVTEGMVNILKGTHFAVRKIKLQEAEHPIPGAGSIESTKKILEFAARVKEGDLVICLISGGGSAMLSQPADGLKLEEKQRLIDRLMRAGAPVDELNAVRKHLSKVKGGRLAKKLYPATVINLIISDVVGDKLDVISSAPTVPDRSTFSDAKKVLVRYHLWNGSNACRIIERGVNWELEETPKNGDAAFKDVHSFIIGNNEAALLAADKYMKLNGIKARIMRNVQGDAREVGRKFAKMLKNGKSLIAGGETTVKVTGNGRGGRNQETALSCALGISGIRDAVFASFGTDGIDGNSPADGAVVDGLTIRKGRELGMNAVEFQRNNDSYNFFKRIGACITTGPTRTNVNDVMIGVSKLKKR